jgi:hypothetical protein
MAGELGRDWSLPLLPAGTALFDGLPVGALVLDALAPAIGNGMITMSDRGGEGVLVVRNGAVAERVWVANGVRSQGDDALALIRNADTAMVSARRLADDAMVLLGPLLHGDPCYADLRLEWVAWSQFLIDLCGRGQTFVVELSTPSGRGVTCIQGGRQMATFAESHPALGDASLLDDIAAHGVGTIRVLVDDRAADDLRPASTAVVAPSADAVQPQHPTRAFEPAPAEHHESYGLTTVTSELKSPVTPRPAAVPTGDPDDTFSAIFGTHRETSEEHSAITLYRTPRDAEREVASMLPQLRLLVQNRLQRSSESVEEIVESAATDHQSVGWLSDRVRVMTMRGFLHSTFDQLADDMLALAARDQA